ncbi:fibronectin type III domain-containing protein [Curtobacterium sp. MCSS17_008]|uniref:fibronectin type III domain-containing protein n=1 Tax=Curtobacterium sp. MCSS17_008 TaxID=2175647 RepID=UPI0015E8D636|nr:fibronectin type III domain-containing protein [Curtobacterium sp. MCSS17_008]
MFRAVLTALVAVALVVGGVSPATAAPTKRGAVPGAPTAVRVAGSADGAIVTWGAPRSGARITGWKVAITPAEDQPDRGVDRLPASARSDRFGHLTPGTEYRFAVRAVGAKRTGPAVTVRYTAPVSVATVQSLFALDESGAVLRFPTTGRGAGRVVVPTGGEGFTADDLGDVFVPSADRSAITMHPAHGGPARTIASGLRLTADLRSDVAGNLYWVDSVSGAITKLPVTGGAPVVVLPSSGVDWAVGRDGTVAVFSTTSPQAPTATVTTVRADGVRTTRTVDQPSHAGFSALLADGSGTLYLDYWTTGASGATTWWALPAGSSALVRASPRLAFDHAAVNDRSFVLAQSAEWCAAPAENRPGGCGVDKTLADLVTRDAAGGTTEQTTSGVASPGRGVHIGAADAEGDLFLAVGSGATPGLWRLSADGGPAQQLATGWYPTLLVI